MTGLPYPDDPGLMCTQRICFGGFARRLLPTFIAAARTLRVTAWPQDTLAATLWQTFDTQFDTLTGSHLWIIMDAGGQIKYAREG